jgi:hypothetical protein
MTSVISTADARQYKRQACLQKCIKLIEQLGGTFKFATEDDFYLLQHRDGTGYESAPFTTFYELGVIWHKKLIMSERGLMWPHLVHEMAHTFASKHPPDKADEWEFFGWEYAVARYVGDVEAWRRSNVDYQIDDGGPHRYGEFGALSRRNQNKICTERLYHAKKIGIVSKDNFPLSIR